MAYATISTSSVATGTYGIVNECVGQIAAQLMAANNELVLVDDNAPVGGASGRTINMRMGTNGHILRVNYNSNTGVYISIRNIAGTAALVLVASYNVASLLIPVNGATWHLLYGPNTLFIISDNFLSVGSMGFLKGSDLNWYVVSCVTLNNASMWACGPTEDTVFPISNISSFTTQHLASPADMKIPLFNAYISNAVTALASLNAAFMVGNHTLTPGGIYMDGIYTYWYYLNLANGWSLMISDRA